MSTPDYRPLPSQDAGTAPNLAVGQRIGDSERDRAVSALSEHFAVGRLDHAELDARLEAAYRATTVDQLVALFADLPDPAPFRLNRRERRAAARAARRASGGELVRWPAIPAIPVFPVVALLVVVAVLFAPGGHPPFLFPMLWFWFFWSGFGRRRWYHHPPHR